MDDFLQFSASIPSIIRQTERRTFARFSLLARDDDGSGQACVKCENRHTLALYTRLIFVAAELK